MTTKPNAMLNDAEQEVVSNALTLWREHLESGNGADEAAKGPAWADAEHRRVICLQDKLAKGNQTGVNTAKSPMAGVQTVTTWVHRTEHSSAKVSVNVRQGATQEQILQAVLDTPEIPFCTESAHYALSSEQQRRMTAYAGTLRLDGVTHQFEFAAPSGAEYALVDACALDGIAQIADVDYLALGDYDAEGTTTTPNEADISAFIARQLVDGSLSLEEVARRMVAYGCMSPASFKAEMAERMRSDNN